MYICPVFTESTSVLAIIGSIAILTNHRRSYRTIWFCFLLAIGAHAFGQVVPDSASQVSVQDTMALDSGVVDSVGPTILTDSLPPSDSISGMPTDFEFGGGQDSLPPNPAAQRQQRIIDSLKRTSDLRASVTYNAEDSIVFDVRSGKLYLYSTGTLQYEDINLTSDRIEVDIEKRQLFASPRDSNTTIQEELPQFTQGEETYRAKTMSYNFGSGKARVTGGRLVQQDIYVLAEVAKYQDDGSFHGADGKFTTCDLDHPHFYIEAKKLKVLPNRQIITGPLRPVIAGLPIPIYLPFGFVPGNLSLEGKKRGILQPQYGNADDRGFFLRGLGYYWPINEYFDLALDGDIYTRGGWRLGATTNYNVRYKYSGSLNLQYGIQRFNEPTDPDFSRTAAWSIRWSHRQPINPTASLNGSVNISSSRQFRQVNVNDPNYFSNNLNSSVAFQKSFNNLPFSFNVSARHQQDLNKETVSLYLPDLTLNMARQTPFSRITNKNLQWLKQLGINYNMRASNSLVNVPDSLFAPIFQNLNDPFSYPISYTEGDTTYSTQTGLSFFNSGLQHTASTATSIRLFKKNLTISPSFNYKEVWYLESTRKEWDPEAQEIIEEQIPGFTRGYEFNTAVSASTNFYGLYYLTRSKRQVAFRQRFSPSISYNLRPDFSDDRWGFYRQVQRDTLGNVQTYSIFEEGLYGGPGRGESQAISFGIGSVVEMKYLKRGAEDPDFDEKDRFERINLIDNLSLRSSYNFAADSFQLAPFTMNARTSLFNRQVNLNASATMDPYYYGYDEVPFPYDPGSARRQNVFMIEETGQIGRLTRAQISLSTNFRPDQDRGRGNVGESFDEEQFQEVQNAYYQYVDFTIPWTMSLRYNLSYSKPGLDDPTITSTINLQGDVRFGSQWKVQYTTGFDMVQQEFTNTTFSIFRDLHCFQMSFRWIPFGPRKSYSLVISAKSSTLSALRVTKNDFWTDRFTN